MRLGCLPYLNVRPLVYTLEHGGLPEEWRLVYDVPARLARMLEEEYVAAAPVSSFAVLNSSDMQICPGICIASEGKVESVLILSKVPVEEVRSVGLDSSSLTGRAMTRIILSELYGLQCEYHDMGQLGVQHELEKHDACLLIGDPAMKANKESLYVYDVGEKWHELTGFPAVFALWAGYGIDKNVERVLREAKDAGMQSLSEIAREQASVVGVDYDFALHYLMDVMVYDMGVREEKSLEIFRDKCMRHGMFAKVNETRTGL